MMYFAGNCEILVQSNIKISPFSAVTVAKKERGGK
jgi:hypothetical protein